MLQNDYLVTQIGVATAENEPFEVVPASLVITSEICYSFAICWEGRGLRYRLSDDKGRLFPVRGWMLRGEDRPAVTWPRHITLSEARSRLDRRRSLQGNSHFSAFFKIYKIFTMLRRSNLKIFENFVNNLVIQKAQIFGRNFIKSCKI